MLGLGDIVIPGLLLSFAHRYDLSVSVPILSFPILLVTSEFGSHITSYEAMLGPPPAPGGPIFVRCLVPPSLRLD